MDIFVFMSKNNTLIYTNLIKSAFLGTNLFIPIIDKDPRFDRFSYFLERTNKRRAGLLVTPVPEDDDDLKGEPFFDFLKKAKEEGK